ncbi:uncharacterized protein MEPE_01973 [Melanopsichium pennsylvanicum]|uniref:WD40 repeat-like protein n=2 Tax=Melanopsichium pennsylvanicum TaxID=63383 RepID=A0AAJ5C434_9BASI|nr:wd40 repeat-like protein [Melanopsichium pennsylvanicum 4]SNX83266.1 uncharacterized protein MEPE_01973 [Melanopsichium pennsylvanicum]
MQTTSNATLFQTSYSEALGAYRSRKAIHTSGLAPDSTEARQRYGYPIHLHPHFEKAVIENPENLAVEGSGADGGRYRVLSVKVEGGCIWCSEAGGVVRQVDAENGKTLNLYKGAKAPVPTFDFLTTAVGEQLLVTGSWDKSLRIYRVTSIPNEKSTSKPILEIPNAMADFIKSIHIFTSSHKTYISAAGSDKSIMLYDATPLLSLNITSVTVEGTLKCVYQNKSHTRPVNVVTSLLGLDGTTRIYSADSMGRVLEFILNPDTLRLEVNREIQGFSTAVYDLKVGWRRVEVEGEPNESETTEATDAFVSRIKEDLDGGRYKMVAELWAASGDKSCAGYRLSPLLQPHSASKTAVQSTNSSIPLLGKQEPLSTPCVKIIHKDFVKCVLPLAFSLHPTYSHFDRFSEAVVTGASDEHVRLFSNPFNTDGQVNEVEGHWHEITSLAIWTRNATTSISNAEFTKTTTTTTTTSIPTANDIETWIISAGLDGSIRRWNLASIQTLPKPQLQPLIQQDQTKINANWNEESLPPVAPRRIVGDHVPIVSEALQITADEEAELAELMANDDDE